MRRLALSCILALAVGCGGSSAVSSGGGTRGTSGGSGSSSGSGSTGAGSSTGTTTAGASSGTTGTSGAGSGSGGSSGSTICDTQRCVVYASADHDLYQVDPTTLNETHLCSFGGALTSTDVVTDIAVTAEGTLYAITKTRLFTVDPQTCVATLKTSLSTAGTSWVGLTFTANGLLLGADSVGNVVTIDPASGAVTPAGSFGGTLICSGDIVAIQNGTIYATAKDTSCSSGCNDKLVTLDPNNGYHATAIGDVGTYHAVYGLGYWGGKLYGFQHGGATLQIDPASGATSEINFSSGVAFSGGATTPLAPVFQ